MSKYGLNSPARQKSTEVAVGPLTKSLCDTLDNIPGN